MFSLNPLVHHICSATSATLRCGQLLVLMALGLGLGIAGTAEGSTDVAPQPRTTIPTEKPGPDHERFLKVAKAGGVDVLFLGDSITAHWRIEGRPVWEKYFAPLKAANFGIGGDRTENVIWRLRHGELEGIQPKLVVLLIGINNGPDPVADVALGIKTIISDINERSPSSRILLLGIFPTGHGPHVAGTGKQAQVNAITATYADNRRVAFMDIGDAFLSPERLLEKDIMPDFVHLSEKGYQIWADAIHDTVVQLLHEDPSHLTPRFNKPSSTASVAKIEELITAGNVGAGMKALEKLVDDKDTKTAEAAAASLAVVTTWKRGIDDQIAKLRQDGDLFLVGEMAAGMAAGFTGDLAKPYQQQLSEAKKDPAYAAGQAYQKLRLIPYAQRKDPRFATMIDAFVKKYPAGYYTALAQALVPSGDAGARPQPTTAPAPRQP